MKTRPTDQCRECHRPTRSGKKEPLLENRVCSFHTAAAKARLANLQEKEKASRWKRKYGAKTDDPKKRIAKPRAIKNPGNVPLLCVHPRILRSTLEDKYFFTGVVCGRSAPRNPQKPENPLFPNRRGEPLCSVHKRGADDPKLYPDAEPNVIRDPLDNDGPYRFLSPRIHAFIVDNREDPVILLTPQNAHRFDKLLEEHHLPIPADAIAEDLRAALLKSHLILPVKSGRAFNAGRQLHCIVSLPGQIVLGMKKPYTDERSQQLMGMRKRERHAC